MKFLVEIDHPKTGQPPAEATTRAFINDVILPTLAKAEQMVKEGRIVAGGPVAGRIALRFIADVESAVHLDELLTSLPLWAISDTRVTALIEFNDRRGHVQAILKRLSQP